MIDKTTHIKQKMLSLDDSFERLKLLKDQYKGETAYIVATGPSLKNYNKEKLKLFLKDKFVLGVKQSYDVLKDIVDIHLLNFCNYKHFQYTNIEKTIISWIVYMQNQPSYIIQNNIPCDFMMPLTRNHAGFENTLAAKKDFQNMLIETSFQRPWGSGKKYIKYDHFYSEGEDGSKPKYGENILSLPVGGSAGMSFEETKIVIDSTKDLYNFLKSINVELNIVSDRNPAYKNIPRIQIPEII
jgi:hypothetical protein